MVKIAHASTVLVWALFSFVNAVSKSPGCGKNLLSGILQGGIGKSNNISITTSDNLQRTYLLHVPVNYNKDNARGLIFSFHGRAEDADNQEKLSKFSDPDINPDMLAVYPLGIQNKWQGDPDATTDDVQFTLDMLASISSTYCIDLDRVYAAGKSNGGGFSANVLACDPIASTKIAAFAGAAGAYYQGHNIDQCDGATYPITCNPGRKPVPIFETHGTVDPVILYDGGARRTRCLPSIPHFMTEWSKRNGLGSSNVSTSLVNGKVIKYEFGADAGLLGIDTHYKIANLGHAWPDTVPNPDGCCSYINGSQLMMEFFNKWTLKGASAGESGNVGVGSGTPSSSSSLVPSSSSSSVSKVTTSSKASSTPTTLTSSVSPKSSPSSTGTRTSTATKSSSLTSSSSTNTRTTASTTSKPSPLLSSSSTSTHKSTSSATTSSSASSYPSPSCPSANGTNWTTPSKGRFFILCEYDTHAIPYGKPIYDLRNFGLCMKYCEADANCGHVTYDGTCSLKKVNTAGIYKHGNNINRVAIKSSARVGLTGYGR